jgi:hypothetical protein
VAGHQPRPRRPAPREPPVGLLCPLAHQELSKWFYDTFIGIATRAVRCGS